MSNNETPAGRIVMTQPQVYYFNIRRMIGTPIYCHSSEESECVSIIKCKI